MSGVKTERGNMCILYRAECSLSNNAIDNTVWWILDYPGSHLKFRVTVSEVLFQKL